MVPWALAQAIIERGDEPVVERFAKNVIAAEQVSIENMQEMLKDMEAPPVKGHPSMDMEGGHGG
jgi:uncharacterized protein (DUF305 family)